MGAKLREGVDEDGRDWRMRTLMPFKNKFISKSGNLNGLCRRSVKKLGSLKRVLEDETRRDAVK